MGHMSCPFLSTANIGIFVPPTYSSGKNMDFGCLHTGQRQLDGRCSNGVPGGMPFLGSPMAGSYTQPHFAHLYFFMTVFSNQLIINYICVLGWGKITQPRRCKLLMVSVMRLTVGEVVKPLRPAGGRSQPCRICRRRRPAGR